MKRKALGRGLAELIPEFEEENFQFVPVENIVFSPFQPRVVFKEDKDFEELVNSIKKNGVLQPIIVRKKDDNFFECIAGERRLRAAKKAGLKEIPAVIKNFSDEEVLIIALIENLQRKDLNPIEEALSYKTLIEKLNYTQEEIGKRVGKDRTTIANFIRLLNLPSLIQNDLIEGRLSVGHAKVLLSLDSEDKQIEIRNLILKKNLSVRETENLIKRLQAKKKEKRKNEADPNLISLSRELSKLTKIPLQIKVKREKIYFVFEFTERNQMENFVKILKKSFSS